MRTIIEIKINKYNICCTGKVIDIKDEGEARFWNVFEINGENGNILEINQIVEDEPLY